MESEAGVNGDSHPWSSETNWTVVHGSLVNSVTFESSFSVINADDDLKSTAKRCPLTLKPTAPDSTPCEITVSFAQKHELRQIYVKSTACVYEIYRQSNQQSEKEYVWTVRCSAAATTDCNDEAQSAYPNGSHENPSKENYSGSESNRTGSSEEEWVKVKVPDSSLLLIKPEYYEATAQISEVDPCTSVTIRFLSVRSKDSVFVDEVYVFADPFESTDSENSNGNSNFNSNGNSLMAMLLPSLSLMSKTKNSTGKIEEKRTFETQKKPDSQEFSSELSCSSKLHESPVNDRVERSLDQLFVRIGRIEDMFSRLEENLLKPMNSIEARLGRVEMQLEVLLTDKHKAPNFSSEPSDPDRENDYCPRSEDFESNAKSFDSDVIESTVLLPSLVITAPEFSNCDDDDDDDDEEEENQGSDDIMGEIFVDPPKRVLTVDDALAAALAGLMIQSGKDTPALSIKAPEFSNVIESDDEKCSLRGQQDLGGPEETESEKGSLLLSIEANCVEDYLEDGSERGRIRSEEEMTNALHEVESGQPDSGGPEEAESEKGLVSLSTEVNAVEDCSKDEKRNALHEFFGSSFSAPSAVDFESPVLDVKFLSSFDNSRESNFSLEALLSDSPDEPESVKEANCTVPSENEHCELISVEEGDEPVVGPVFDREIFVDFNYCNVQEDEIPLASGTFPTTLI